ncbi:MAG: hypothetical protein LBB26_04030 [Puniceicoccales bacterium]|jgi:hypothetical protein|nr:hypothetical protein [Puniceicoccales bacterium]
MIACAAGSVRSPDQPSPHQSSKFEAGVTDARGVAGHIALMNLLQSAKFLPHIPRTILNWILTGISVISSIVIPILKLVGVGIAVFSGPIGWAISLGLFALSVVISLVIYKIACRNSAETFQKTGYQLDPASFYASNFPPNDRRRIRLTSELCEKLPSSSVVLERAWPAELMEQRDALQKAGFELASGPDVVTLGDGCAVTVHQFRNDGLGIGFAVAVDQVSGDTYFLPTTDAGHTERMTALACAVCPWEDARAEAFDVAFRNILTAYGDNVILTGDYIGGMFAQFLGLKYGCEAFCYNPYGIGPIYQQIIGQNRMAENAPVVHNFIVPELQTWAQKFANAIDLPLTFLTGYQTPGVFGQRYTVPYLPGNGIFPAIRAALDEQEIFTP